MVIGVVLLAAPVAMAQSVPPPPPGAELHAMRQEIAELRETLKQTQAALTAAKADLEQLRDAKLTPADQEMMQLWRQERERLGREQRLLFQERQRVEQSREMLQRTMRAEAQRYEAGAEEPAQAQHAPPQYADPGAGYRYQYGPYAPDYGYGGYYAPPGLGIYIPPHHRHHHHGSHYFRHGRFYGVPFIGAYRDYYPQTGTYTPWVTPRGRGHRSTAPQRGDYIPNHPGIRFNY